MKQPCALALVIAATALAGCSDRGSAGSEKTGMDVLRQNRDAMFALKGYQAVCFTETKYDPGGKPKGFSDGFEMSILVAEKPMKMRYDSWSVPKIPYDGAMVRPKTTPVYTFASDGLKLFRQFGKYYRSDPKMSPDRMFTILEPWGGFYSTNASQYEMVGEGRASGETATVNYGGTEAIAGVLCDKVLVHKVSNFRGTKQDSDTTFYIGKSDHLMRRSVEHILFDEKPGFTKDATIRDIELNPTVNPDVYRYTPPPGIHPEEARRHVATLHGLVAPDFVALDKTEKPVRPSDFRGKVVVIDFWASWCGPCKASMPHTQEVIKRLTNSGVPLVALAVDDNEDRTAFDAWVSANQAKYPNLTFVFSDPKKLVSSSLYHVPGIPTQFVVDARGVIRASFVGYGGPTKDLELAIIAAAKSKGVARNPGKPQGSQHSARNPTGLVPAPASTGG